MRTSSFIVISGLAASLAFAAVPKDQQSFSTPEAAVQALVKAAQAKDTRALVKLFGPLGEPLVDSGDPVDDKNARDNFLARYKAGHSLDKSDPAKVTLEIGEDKFPFPIPIASSDGKWYWDSAAGAEEQQRAAFVGGRGSADVARLMGFAMLLTAAALIVIGAAA